MTHPTLADSLEAGAVEMQRELLEAAFYYLVDNAYWDACVDLYGAQCRFLQLLDVEAYVDAAMMLVPEGWNWMAGNRDHPAARAYVNNGELAFVGAGARQNPSRKWFEVVAATPALALAAACLRAHSIDGENSRG